MVPHGFKFNPTDEELIEILDRKVSGQEMPLPFITQINVYEREPQDLEWNHNVALRKDERYYYCKKENDSREVIGKGWWKATSHVKKLYAHENLVGCKRPLTFHKFRDFNDRSRNNAIKTNWIMHEYSLESTPTEWRLCKIKHKGKPSIQEEMENMRQINNNCFINDFEAVSFNNPMNTHLDSITNHHHQQYQHQMINYSMSFDHDSDHHHHYDHEVDIQQQQPLQLSCDDDVNNSNGFGYFDEHQLLENDLQLFSSDLWSWQN